MLVPAMQPTCTPASVSASMVSFIDGIVYTVTFSVSALTGVLVSIGMVLHEFPEGIFTYVLLRKGGVLRSRRVPSFGLSRRCR